MNYLNNELIVLVHGFNKNESDMFPLKQECTDLLSQHLQTAKLNNYNKIHLVGHSMGGLIIRNYLAHNELLKLGRCVFGNWSYCRK